MNFRNKQCLSAILFIILLLYVNIAAAQSPEEILVSYNWRSAEDNSILEFSPDGTGTIMIGGLLPIGLEWSVVGEQIQCKFSGLSAFSNNTSINSGHSQTNFSVTVNSGTLLTIKESDGQYKLYIDDSDQCYISENKDGSSIQTDMQVSTTEQPSAQTMQLGFGEEVTLDFVRFSFNSVQLQKSLGGDFSWLFRAPKNCYYYVLSGKIENLSGSALLPNCIKATMVFDNKYTYDANTNIMISGNNQSELSPLCESDFCIAATIPQKLVDTFSTCNVYFSFNNEFLGMPADAHQGDYCYEMVIEGETAARSKKEPLREITYFEKCPILPTPSSYVDVYQSSSHSSSSNGKTTRIIYSFSLTYSDDNLSEFLATYVAELKSEGFVITANGKNEYEIADNGKKLATVTLKGDKLEFDIVPGSENLISRKEVSEQPPIPEEKNEYLSIGDTLPSDNFEMTVTDFGTTDHLNEISGFSTYYNSNPDAHFFYVFGDFKNLLGSPVDLANISVAFTFDDKYSYEGIVCGVVKKGRKQFVRDASPMRSISYYAYADVPKEVLNSYKTCLVTLGFTDDFRAKIVTSGGLPMFETCDEVYKVLVERNANGNSSSGKQAIVQTKSSPLKLRKTPGGSAILKIPKGETVTVIKDGDWALVEYDGKQGYVDGSYLVPVE